MDVDVLSVLLPHVETSAALGNIVRSMGERAGWKLAEGVDPLDGDLTLLGLTVGVDLGYWSEILGFGQGDELAYTRRAPFTELAIRAKPPRSARQDRGRSWPTYRWTWTGRLSGDGERDQSVREPNGSVTNTTRAAKPKWTTVIRRSTGA